MLSMYGWLSKNTGGAAPNLLICQIWVMVQSSVYGNICRQLARFARQRNFNSVFAVRCLPWGD